MKSKPGFAFRRRMVLVAVTCAFVVAVAGTVIVGTLVAAQAESHFDTMCRLMGAMIAERLEEPLWTGDGPTVGRLAAVNVGRAGVMAIAVLDRDRRTVAVYPADVPANAGVTAWPADEDVRPGFALRGVPVEATFQVVRRGGEAVGGVWLAVDRRPVDRARERFMLTALAGAGGVLLLAWLTSWMAAGRMVRALDQLADTVAALGRGEYSVRHPVQGAEEVRRLARRVNKLAEQLETGAAEHARTSDEFDQQLRERTRQIEQANRLLRDIANRDPLTQLLNRLGLEMEMEKYLSLCRRSGQPLAVIMMDLDSFKAYNDTHGHAAGDTALVSVAAALRARARASDVVARLGGDEFCIIIPFTRAERAVTAAEGFVAAVVDATLDLPRLDSGAQLGASAGVACFPEDGDEGPELLARADAALYRAKAAGRGRVLRAAPQEPAPQG